MVIAAPPAWQSGDLATARDRQWREATLPVLCFVNRKAGAKLGARVLKSLNEQAMIRKQAGVAPLEVVDVSELSPKPALLEFASKCVP